MPDDGSQNPYLDRIRAILETFAQGRAGFEDEHRRLLHAEAVMVDAVRRLGGRPSELDASLKAMADAGRRADESLKALRALVDGMARRPPPPPA
jgi:hypothetical protein